MKLTFLGATGTVTGSKYLIETGGRRVLVDCGLFQGLKELRLRNWDRFPVDPRSIDCVVITHAHVDHTGYLPVLVKAGFSGPIYATPATRDLCKILLPDSGYLQEEEARYANKKGFSKHHPALPLYTQREAEQSLRHFRTLPAGIGLEIVDGLTLTFQRAGHLLGASIARLEASDLTVVFSGDLGRPHDPVLLPPEPIRHADYLILESTYGDRRHDEIDPAGVIADAICRTVQRGGVIIVPAFAVGRTQTLLYHLHRLRESGRIPPVPIFLNSPMAINASRLFIDHHEEQRLSEDECREMCELAHYVNSVEESKSLNRRKEPMVVISASGMATGGRVLHHLKAFAPDPKNLILFAGFQAAGTRGEAMLAGVKEIKIHGELVPVRAEVLNVPNLSAHADYTEILDWLKGFEAPPRRTFITHGEPNAAAALEAHIGETLGWSCHQPAYLEQVGLERRKAER